MRLTHCIIRALKKWQEEVTLRTLHWGASCCQKSLKGVGYFLLKVQKEVKKAWWVQTTSLELSKRPSIPPHKKTKECSTVQISLIRYWYDHGLNRQLCIIAHLWAELLSRKVVIPGRILSSWNVMAIFHICRSSRNIRETLGGLPQLMILIVFSINDYPSGLVALKFKTILLTFFALTN